MRVCLFIFLLAFCNSSVISQLPYPQSAFRLQGTWLEDSQHLKITYSSIEPGTALKKRLAGTEDAYETVLILNPAGGEFIDSNVVEGVIYQYDVSYSDSLIRNVEFGGKIPLIENRGWYLILIDDVLFPGIEIELKKFKWNLIADGYRVKTINVNRSQSSDEIRSLIQTTHANTPGGLTQVLLLGHVPVPYSGIEGFDIHPDHDGCWATDTYYADLDGEWLDEATVDYPDRDANKNFPGDRKFDHDNMPSAAELEIGRVDMFDLPVFGMSDVAMVNRYLAKNNLFKSGNLTILGRGLECRDSIYDFAEVGAYHFAPLVGSAGLQIGPYSILKTQPKLFSAGYGSGNYDICGGVITSAGYTSGSWFTVFTSLIGSYLQDFDNTNSVMRSSLFSQGIILCCSSGSEDLQYMGLGKSIGYCTKRKQKLNSPISGNLHGDPSLRVNYPIMPSALSLELGDDSASSILSWTASTETDEPLMGYNVYRTSNIDSTWTRINSAPLQTTNFTDENPAEGKNYYLVKLITLRPSGSGNFYNSSIGLIDSLIVPIDNSILPEWDVNWLSAQTYCLGQVLDPIITSITGEVNENELITASISDLNGNFEFPEAVYSIDINSNPIIIELPDNIPAGNNYRFRLESDIESIETYTSETFEIIEEPQISFDYSVSFDTLSFSVSSASANEISIETGDGIVLTADDTLHIYQQNGDFTITVSASNSCGEISQDYTISSSINPDLVTSSAILNNSALTVYFPNPVSDKLTINNEEDYQWDFYDSLGRILVLDSGKIGSVLIVNTSILRCGVYYAICRNNNSLRFKFIK